MQNGGGTLRVTVLLNMGAGQYAFFSENIYGMGTRRKRQGSVIFCVLIMVTAITAVLLVTAEVSITATRDEARRTNKLIAREAINGAISQFLSDQELSNVSLPFSTTITVNSLACILSVTDNSPSLAKTLKIVASASYNGLTVNETRIVGSRQKPSPFYYAIAIDKDTNLTGTVTTGSSGSNGHIYANGNLSIPAALSAINGDAEATGSIAPSSLSVTGTTWSAATQLSFPSITRSDYSGAASAILLSGNINGYTFLNLIPGSYPVAYWNGDGQLKGTIAGRGTFYFAGNLDIKGDITYLNAIARVVVICEGNLTIDNNTNFVGTYFCRGKIRMKGHKSLSVTRGNLIGGDIDCDDDLTIVSDSAFYDDPREAVKHHAPGFWP